MEIFVNDRKVEIMPGMRVRHALTAAGLLTEIEEGKGVYDLWDNRVGLDGALSQGERIFVR